MTTPLDSILIPEVLAVLNEYGKSTTITEKSGGTYDPTTGSNTSETETAHSVKISPPAPSKGYITSDLIKEGDMETYLASSGLTIDFENQLEVDLDGVAWKVVKHDALYSGDSICAYKLILRN